MRDHPLYKRKLRSLRPPRSAEHARARERELDAWWDGLGDPDHDPAGYLNCALYDECAKFFTKFHWYHLYHVCMERSELMVYEEAIFLCYASYARYLLRGFAQHPDWTLEAARVASKVPREEEVAAMYKIYGEGVTEPTEGFMEPQTVMRNGKRRSSALMMPVYPGIEAHADEP